MKYICILFLNVGKYHLYRMLHILNYYLFIFFFSSPGAAFVNLWHVVFKVVNLCRV